MPPNKVASDGGGAKLAILDRIDPTGHPARSNEGMLVRLGLVAGGALHGDVVQPNIRAMRPRVKMSPCRSVGFELMPSRTA